MATHTDNTLGKRRAVTATAYPGGAQIIPMPSGWRFPPPLIDTARDDEMIEIIAGLLPEQVIPCAFGMLSQVLTDNDMPAHDRLDRLNMVRLCASRVLIEEGRL